MARYTGPKYKKERRVGVNLGLKTKPSKRIEVPPGQHGRKGRRKLSSYGEHLLEKQKLRWTYGISENQLKRYFKEAAKAKVNTGERLLQILEQRLDNVVFRLGFTTTLAAARQLVTHGHILVNEKKVNIPSYRVRTGEIITLTPKALNIPTVKESLEEKKELPGWLEKKGAVGKIVETTTRDQIPLDINEQLIIEFYSR